MADHIFLFYGEDQETLKKEVKRWEDSFLGKHPDSPNLSKYVENYSLSKIVAEAKTIPFIDDKRLVIIYNVYGNYKGTEEYDNFAKDLSNIPAETILLILEEDTVPKNAKILKDIGKVGNIKFFQKSKSSLKKTFQKIIEKESKRIDPMVLDELIINLNEDPFRIRNEAIKLSLYSAKEDITQEDIDNIVRFDTQISVFRLMDNLTAKDIKKCIDDLNDLNSNGEDLIRLFYLFARQIRILLAIKYLRSQKLTPKEIAKITKLHPFVITKTINQVEHFPFAKLMELLEKLLEIDIKIKSGKIKYSKNSRNQLLFALEDFLIHSTSK